MQTATAAELAAATAAVLRRAEQPASDAGFTSGTAKRMQRSESAGSSSSAWGHREMMTPSSRRNKRASSGSNATAQSAGGTDEVWPLTEISTSMLLDAGHTGEEHSPGIDSPAKIGGKAAAGLSQPHHETHSVSASSVAEEGAAAARGAGGTSAGSVASRSSVATHVGHVARTFSPQVLRAAAAAYHASFAAKHSTRVLPPAAALTECMPGPGETSTSSPVFAMRRAAWMKPDENVLRQLLPLRRVDEASLQERLAAGHGIHVSRSAAPISSEGLQAGGSSGQGAGSNVAFHSMLEGHVPAVLINNALLRQHFRSLTRDFLQPFEGYFSVARAAAVATAVAMETRAGPQRQPPHMSADSAPQSVAQGTDGRHRSMRTLPSSAGGVQLQHSYGPYDDLADALLPAFDKTEFLAQLKRRGPPKLLAASKWLALYRAFVAGPLFPTWFHARRTEAKQHLQYLSRALRVSATDASIHACILPRGASALPGAAAGSDQLYAPLNPQEANSAAANACTLWHRVRLALRDAYGAAQRDDEYHTAMRRHAGVVWRWLRPDARQLVADTERTLYSFGDADSAWILKHLVGNDAQCPVQSPAQEAPRTDAAREALPNGGEDQVDFAGTQHAMLRSALGMMESALPQGQDRHVAAASLIPGVAQLPGHAGADVPSADTAHSQTGDARSYDESMPLEAPVRPPSPAGAVFGAPAEAAAQAESPSLGVLAVAATPAQHSGPHSPSSGSVASFSTAVSSPTTSSSSTPVQTSRAHHAVQATPLPISPDVSTAHPHVSETRGHMATGRNASGGEHAAAATGALLHLPAGEGSAHSVILGAGGLIGQSRSLGKGHIPIQRR